MEINYLSYYDSHHAIRIFLMMTFGGKKRLGLNLFPCSRFLYDARENGERERRWSITRGNGGLARRNSIALEKQADPLVTNATWLSTGAIRNACYQVRVMLPRVRSWRHRRQWSKFHTNLKAEPKQATERKKRHSNVDKAAK